MKMAAITELSPATGAFVGKTILRDGRVRAAPRHAWWRQREIEIPATITSLFEYLSAARKRNICLIRGAPANPDRHPTRRQIAHQVHGGQDRGDHGFVDKASQVFWLDGDGIALGPAEDWIADPQGAVASIVARLGAPWASTSYVWVFSSTHGLKFDQHKVWTGGLVLDLVRVRLGFLTSRPLVEAEAVALTNTVRSIIPQFDSAISRTVQPNYIARPRWELHPDRDVLGAVPTIGWSQGEEDFLAVPNSDELAAYSRGRRAERHGGIIASYADADAAVMAIGKPLRGDGTGAVYQHLQAAARHLLAINPLPDGASLGSHVQAIVSALEQLIDEHRAEVSANLTRYGRSWADVREYLDADIGRWTQWLVERNLSGKSSVGVKPTYDGTDAQPAQTARHALTQIFLAFIHASAQWFQKLPEASEQASPDNCDQRSGQDQDMSCLPPPVHAVRTSTGTGKTQLGTSDLCTRPHSAPTVRQKGFVG